MLEKNYHANARMATVLIAVSYWPHFSSPGFSHSITTQGEAGGRGMEDTVNGMQSRRYMYSYEEPYSVLKRRHLASVCTARLWVENFVGGKFRDLSMSHENNENWHPTKITPLYGNIMRSTYIILG